jgi:hypothetical protein
MAVGLALALVTFFGTWTGLPLVHGTGVTLEGDVKTPCWNGSHIEDGIDPRPLIEKAHVLLSRLQPATAANLRGVAAEFDLERNLRIQQALFREDLVWMNRGYSARQMDLMIFVTVALSLESAGKLESELRRSLNQNLDPKVMRRLKAIDLYMSQAVALLQRLSRELDDIPNHELRFYYY